MTMTETRVAIAALFTVAGVFIAVPIHYWGLAASALTLTASAGKAGLLIHRHIRHRRP